MLCVYNEEELLCNMLDIIPFIKRFSFQVHLNFPLLLDMGFLLRNDDIVCVNGSHRINWFERHSPATGQWVSLLICVNDNGSITLEGKATTTRLP